VILLHRQEAFPWVFGVLSWLSPPQGRGQLGKEGAHRLRGPSSLVGEEGGREEGGIRAGGGAMLHHNIVWPLSMT
jgi:hypothetical protein